MIHAYYSIKFIHFFTINKHIQSFAESELDKDIIEQWIEDDKTFIFTKASEEVNKLIRKQNLVIVAGNSGSGKSAIIQHIALEYRRQGWVVKIVHNVNELKEIISNTLVLQRKTVCVLNDPIGKRFFDELAYNSWETHEETLRVSLKKIKLLLSCRKYILYDDRVRVLLNEKSNIVDIDNKTLKLNKKEKKKFGTLMLVM